VGCGKAKRWPNWSKLSDHGDKPPVATHEAQAYKDPGTAEEQSRRQFLANATIAIGGVIGLVLTVPLVGSLIPESLLESSSSGIGGAWSDLGKDGIRKVDSKPGTPISLTVTLDNKDGYFPPASQEESVWAVRMSDEQAKKFKTERPDLFGNSSQELKYPAVVMNYVVFSPICTHLGCRYEWNADATRFICPCHGSQFDGTYGTKLAGPAPRGLDPLPFREKSGQAQVTWIQYKSGTPDRVIVAYS